MPPPAVFPVNGEAEHLDFIDSSLAEEEEEEEETGSPFRALSAPYLAGVSHAVTVGWILFCGTFESLW